MTDDIEFISNVKALATNGTLNRLFEMIEADEINRWRSLPDADLRDECWHTLNGIRLLRAKIQSLTDDEKVRSWALNRSFRRV